MVVVSPVEVVKSQGARAERAASPEYTPPCQSDIGLFDRLVRSGRFDEARALCSEKLLAAPHEFVTLQWTKDLTIILRAEGRADDALAVLSGVRYIAARATGQLRGKYENGLGRTLAMLGRSREAREAYDRSIFFHTDPVRVAEVVNNKGLLLVAEGAPEEALMLFGDALGAARAHGAALLQAEVLDSIARAHAEQARRAALASAELFDELRRRGNA